MEILLKYFPDLTEAQKQRFALLQSLYSEWNEKINVISRKDIQFLYERHILHSLGIAKVMPFTPGSEILDVGTGGGFPGIPLAILFPDSRFQLVDSIGKKITVVQEVSKALKLDNLVAHNKRAESVNDKFDFVVSRAVTRIGPFCTWVKDKFLKGDCNPLPNGILYLKGGDLEEELADIRQKKYRVFELKDFFEEEFFETKKVLYVPAR